MTSARLPPAFSAPSGSPLCSSAACGSATGSTAAALRRRLFGFACFTSFTSRFLAATRQPFIKRHERASLPSRRSLRKPDDLARDIFRRLALGVELRVRLEIERLAVLEHLSHPSHGVLTY